MNPKFISSLLVENTESLTEINFAKGQGHLPFMLLGHKFFQLHITFFKVAEKGYEFNAILLTETSGDIKDGTIKIKI